MNTFQFTVYSSTSNPWHVMKAKPAGEGQVRLSILRGLSWLWGSLGSMGVPSWPKCYANWFCSFKVLPCGLLYNQSIEPREITSSVETHFFSNIPFSSFCSGRAPLSAARPWVKAIHLFTWSEKKHKLETYSQPLTFNTDSSTQREGKLYLTKWNDTQNSFWAVLRLHDHQGDDASDRKKGRGRGGRGPISGNSTIFRHKVQRAKLNADDKGWWTSCTKLTRVAKSVQKDYHN